MSDSDSRPLKRALIIDDHPLFCDALSMTLKVVAGLQSVETAGSLEEATTRLDRDPAPDLVVLDLMMPLVDGHQVLDTMKSDPVLSSIPVVVLSAVARERPVGAAAFLRKPIPLQKFFDTIKGFVEAGLPRPGLASS